MSDQIQPPSEQKLREAAQLMRERAQAAEAGPWFADETTEDAPTPVIFVPHPDFTDAATVLFQADWGSQDDSRYIASMHPGVALAVADLLDAEAEAAERLADGAMVLRAPIAAALAVALAYLDAGQETPNA